MENSNTYPGSELQKVLTAANFAAKTSSKVLPLHIKRANFDEKPIIEDIMTNGRGYKVMTASALAKAQGFKNTSSKRFIVCVDVNSKGVAVLQPIR